MALTPEELRAKNAAYGRKYRAKHPDRSLAATLAWQARNPEKVRAYNKAYRLANLERVKENKRKWWAAHREEHCTYSHNRRALERVGNHTTAEWRQLRALWAHCCAYCGEAKKLTRDHKIPLVRGGTNHITNIVPACRSCNSRKRTWTAVEYLGVTKYWSARHG